MYNQAWGTPFSFPVLACLGALFHISIVVNFTASFLLWNVHVIMPGYVIHVPAMGAESVNFTKIGIINNLFKNKG
jgi:hypothetical protein